MSLKLIFGLSLFGLAMGFATIFVIAPSTEPYVWAGILVVNAYLVAKYAPKRYFLHGVAVGLLNSVWITGAHYLLFDRYAAGHTRELAMTAHYGAARTMMLAFGPAVGLASGIVLGLCAYFASKFVEPAHSEYAGW
ncbi:MAG TPA: hypothetical protein VIF62_02050 [Labilithrix sp.]